MTITHVSHFGLELLNTTETGVVLCGTLGNCKRMAAAHGMEIREYEGRLISYNGFRGTYEPVDMKKPNRIWFKNGGMIQRTPGDYTLVIPRKVWEDNQ